jgi:hypothetical protein
MFLFMHVPERGAPHSGEAEKRHFIFPQSTAFTPYHLLGRGLADLLRFDLIV